MAEFEERVKSIEKRLRDGDRVISHQNRLYPLTLMQGGPNTQPHMTEKILDPGKSIVGLTSIM